MRKVLGYLALANLTALIWLGAFGQALAAPGQGPEGSFKPAQTEVSTSRATVASEPEVKAAPRGSRNQAEARGVTTITLPPKTTASQVDRRTVKRKKAEKMPPTQSYPPAQAQPASGAQEAGPESTADRKRGRNEKRQVTTIELPKKQPAAQSGGRSGRKAGSAESASVNPAAQPGQVQAPAEAAPKTGRPSQKSSRQRTGPKSAVKEPAPSPALNAPARAADDRRNKSSRIKERSRSRSLAPAPDPGRVPVAAAPTPESAGSRAKKRSESRAAVPAPVAVAALPTPPGPAAGLTPEQEMTRAYQAFDLAYKSSLGKSRKELNVLWGFPMQKMGDNGVEVAYGFRQKGLLNLPESGGKGSAQKKKTYYATSSIDPSLPGQYFTCLVVLWVDKKGRGVVVDGEAVGDCFIAETLSRKPDHFER